MNILCIFCILFVHICILLQSSQPLESPRWSVIELELCAWACEPKLGHSLAFCWLEDLIKASTYTSLRQMDNCLQKMHILHIDWHTAAYFLTHSAYLAYCKFAICRICRIWNLHYFLAYYLAYCAYWFAYCSILFDIFCIFCILQYAGYAEPALFSCIFLCILHMHIILHVHIWHIGNIYALPTLLMLVRLG